MTRPKRRRGFKSSDIHALSYWSKFARAPVGMHLIGYQVARECLTLPVPLRTEINTIVERKRKVWRFDGLRVVVSVSGVKNGI